jgi:hypothetical protein
MHFRSITELRLAQAFDQHDVMFFANPRGRIGLGPRRATRVPDFLVYSNGILLDVEIDGPWHERGADIARDRLFMVHGVHPVRWEQREVWADPFAIVAETVAMAQALARRGGIS